MSLAKVNDFFALHDPHHNQVGFWSNEDVKPLPPSRRTWSAFTYMYYQTSVGIIIAVWSNASSLLAFGLSARATIGVATIGYFLVGVICALGADIGSKWHIGFPVSNRFVWGMYGGVFPVLNRTVLNITWFATESWLGGDVVYTFLCALWPSFAHIHNSFPDSLPMTTAQFVAWFIFTFIVFLCTYVRPELFHWPSMVSSVAMFICSICFLAYFLAKVPSGGVLMNPGASVYIGVTPASGAAYGWAFMRGITTVIGSQATGVLGYSDWARYSSTRRAGTFAQGASMTVSNVYTAVIGIICTSCAAELYPDVKTLLWNPALLMTQMQAHGGSRTRAAVAFASLAFLTSQIMITYTGCCTGGGLDLSGVLPKYINIRRGSWFILVIGICIQPWQLANTSTKFIAVMGSYSVFLAPLTGILHCDYYLVRKQRICLTDLFRPTPQSSYWFFHGVNLRAVFTLLFVVPWFLPGFVGSVNGTSANYAPGWNHLFWMAYPLGYFSSMTIYYVANKIFPAAEVGKVDEADVFGTFHDVPDFVEGLDDVEGLPAQLGYEDEKDEKANDVVAHVIGV